MEYIVRILPKNKKIELRIELDNEKLTFVLQDNGPLLDHEFIETLKQAIANKNTLSLIRERNPEMFQKVSES